MKDIRMTASLLSSKSIDTCFYELIKLMLSIYSIYVHYKKD